MSLIQFHCPKCQVKLQAPATLPAGTSVRCPQCGTAAPLPTQGPPPVPVAAPEPARPPLPSEQIAGRVQPMVPVPPALPAPQAAPVAIPLGPVSAPVGPLARPITTITLGWGVCLLLAGSVVGAVLTAPPAYVVGRAGRSSGEVRTAYYPPIPPTTPAPAPPTLPAPPTVRAPEPLPPVGTEVGSLAPEIDAVDADDQRFRLSDYRGKVVVLDFWGDWCPYCKRLFPYERELMQRSRSQPLAVLGVNNDADRDELKALLQREKMLTRCWAVGSGFRNPAFTRWKIEAVPTLVVLDHRGVIRHRSQGAPDADDRAEINRLIDQLIDEQKRDAKR